MVEQGTITCRRTPPGCWRPWGKTSPPPEPPPQESQPPQDGTWEAEHQGDEDCQGPNQRVEIHLEGAGAKPIYQEITSAPWTRPRRCFENLGKIVEDAVTSATQAVDAAWPPGEGRPCPPPPKKAKGPPNPPHRPPGRACWWGPWSPARQPSRPSPWRRTPIRPPAGGPVTRLRVEWVNGPVEIRPWEGDTIRWRSMPPAP